MANLIYTILSAVIYPPFNRKLTDIHGLEHIPASGGYLIASNHVDWLDGFFIGATIQKYRKIPVHFLTKSNNYWWTTIAVQIPVDRSTIIDSTITRLKNGLVICNFPEGVRNESKKLLPGKTGTVRMAAEAGVPVIPAGIACKAGRNMGQSWQFLFSKRHHVSLSFGKPLKFNIPPGGISSEWLNGETERLMRAIAPLCAKIS